MIDTGISLLTIVGNLLARFQELYIQKTQRLDNALIAISEAISETRKYIERENHQQRIRTKELDLSNLWNIAAIRVREIDPNLARRLQLKSSYWTNMFSLPRKEILSQGIALKQIEEEFQNLLDLK